MIKTLVLNLDRSPDRLESITAQFKAIGVPFERMSAVDGKAATEEEFQKFCSTRDLRNTWNRGKMGCFLSHYNAWKIAANSPDAYTAIFEDDMHLSPSLKDFLATDSWIPQGSEIVRLETSTNRVWLGSDVLATHAGREVKKVKSTTWCTGGYIISRDAAKKLLALPENTHDSVDYFLFCFEKSDVPKLLNISMVVPALCVQDKFNHEDNKNIRFFSEIDEIDPQITWVGRLRYLSPLSPLKFALKSVRGYKRIPYAA